MFDAILKKIKEEKDFSKIEKFLNENLEEIESDYTNEGYYVSSMSKFLLTTNIIIQIGSSFDIFGNSRTGGYYIFIQNVITEEKYSLFDKNVTKYNNKEEDIEITIIENVDLINKIKDMIETDTDKIHTYEGFISLLKDKSLNTLCYWKKLPLKLRLKTKEFIFCYMYERAKEKRKDIIEYDKTSPFGGLDISYFPISDGECFFDLMKPLYFFFEYFSKQEYYNELIKFIKKSNENDCFLKKYEDVMYLKTLFDKNILDINSFHFYFEKSSKEYDLVSKLEDKRKLFNKELETLKNLLIEIEKAKKKEIEILGKLNPLENLVIRKKKITIKLKTKRISILIATKEKRENLLVLFKKTKQVILTLEKEIETLNNDLILLLDYQHKNEIKLMIDYFFNDFISNDEYTIVDGMNKKIPIRYYKSFVSKIKEY